MKLMRGHGRFFYGWVVVATATLGLFLGGFPIVVSTFGVFFRSYVREFHVDRGAISLAFTINNVASAFVTVLIGRMADRIGARKVILPGLALLGAILISAEVIGSKVWQLYILYAALGAVGSATVAVPYGLVVSRWFNQSRGLALGLMMIGLGAGSIVMPPLAQLLISAFGWRNALAIAGCVVLLIPVPVVGLFLKESPQRMGLRPDGIPAELEWSGELEGLNWQEIRKDRTFWRIIAALALASASVQACFVHLPQLFADRGSSANAAALASSVFGLAALLGRTASGYFLDRLFGPYVASFVFATGSLGIALLWTSVADAPALLGAFLAGLAFGSEADIIPYLMSRYFGLRSLGRAFGFAFGAFILAGGLGSLIMGFAFDRTGSYRAPLAGFCIAITVAAALVGRLGPYRFAAAQDQEPPARVPPGVAVESAASVEEQ